MGDFAREQFGRRFRRGSNGSPHSGCDRDITDRARRPGFGATLSPPPQAYPRQPLPSADELPPLSMPVVQGAPLPPVGVGPADGDRSGTASHSAVSALPLSPKSQPGPQDYGPPGYYGLRGTIPPGPPASAKESPIREEATQSRLRVRPGQIGSGASRSAWRRLARQYHHARAYLNAR